MDAVSTQEGRAITSRATMQSERMSCIKYASQWIKSRVKRIAIREKSLIINVKLIPVGFSKFGSVIFCLYFMVSSKSFSGLLSIHGER